jgi:hypothetical protein
LDFLYSVTLLVSLTAGASAPLAGLVALARAWLLLPRDHEGSLTQRLCQVADTGAVVSVAFAIVSIGVHMAFGHQTGSAEGLGPLAFFAIHPAYFGVMAMAALGALLSRLARARLTRQEEGSCS